MSKSLDDIDRIYGKVTNFVEPCGGEDPFLLEFKVGATFDSLYELMSARFYHVGI